MAGPGRDRSIDLPDGRVIEYWDGGDPAGYPVILHPGTPETRVMGRWAHDAAVGAGVRLVAVDRPGYGGSTSVTNPSLMRTGLDTAALAEGIGVQVYAVVGLSGGGPFAMATAVADPGHVRALGVVGGIAPWRLLEDDSRDPTGSKCLDLHDGGDVAGAWDCMSRDAASAYAGLATLDDAARADVILARIGAGSRVADDPAYRAIWADNLRVVVSNLDGSTFDNIAWGAKWDVDPSDVVAPTRLWYGELDLQCPLDHGRWYADGISHAELVVLPGERHVDVIDGHWPEVLSGLVSLWRQPSRS
jgi:pimeloyl-ACP methyl ester carboxylesterase